MKSFMLAVLPFVGLTAMVPALLCAFATFTTNDYRPIIASGVILSLMALACFGTMIWAEGRAGVFYAIVGVLPSLLALGELLRRATYMILRESFF
jgi:hypothetical protein